MPQNDTWTPEEIRQLRKRRQETQATFGLHLYDTTRWSAQVLVSQLERGKIRPGKAAARTLNRMRAGEL